MTKVIHVAKPFRLTFNEVAKFDGEGKLLKAAVFRTVDVPAGVQTVPDEVADHWYTQGHLLEGGKGGAAYASAVRDSADQQFVKAKEAMALYLTMEQGVLDAETAAGVEPSEPALTRLGADGPDPRPMLDAYHAAVEAYEPPPEEDPPPPGNEQADGAARAEEIAAMQAKFSAMTDDELRALIKERDGKAPNARAGHDTLVKAAMGDGAAKAEAESDGGDGKAA